MENGAHKEINEEEDNNESVYDGHKIIEQEHEDILESVDGGHEVVNASVDGGHEVVNESVDGGHEVVKESVDGGHKVVNEEEEVEEPCGRLAVP